jgi:hypothetical protein
VIFFFLKKKFTSKKAMFQIFGHKKRLLQKSEKTTQNKKKCFKLSEVMVGSGIRKKPIPDPGSGGQKGTGSRIRIRNTVPICMIELLSEKNSRLKHRPIPYQCCGAEPICFRSGSSPNKVSALATA